MPRIREDPGDPRDTWGTLRCCTGGGGGGGGGGVKNKRKREREKESSRGARRTNQDCRCKRRVHFAAMNPRALF